MNKENIPLSTLKIGDKAVVKELCSNSSIKRRLLDIGLIDGTQVECALKSPFSNPKAYIIRGTLMAIRNEDAAHILVQLIK
ncbi:MAG: FeoA family protein [Bacilli bacterium]